MHSQRLKFLLRVPRQVGRGRESSSGRARLQLSHVQSRAPSSSQRSQNRPQAIQAGYPSALGLVSCFESLKSSFPGLRAALMAVRRAGAPQRPGRSQTSGSAPPQSGKPGRQALQPNSNLVRKKTSAMYPQAPWQAKGHRRVDPSNLLPTRRIEYLRASWPAWPQPGGSDGRGQRNQSDFPFCSRKPQRRRIPVFPVSIETFRPVL
jgi:hypothetical protein